MDARRALLAVEGGAIAGEGQCALRPRTFAPQSVGGTHVLACLPPRHPAVDERVGERRTPLCRPSPRHPAHRGPRSGAVDSGAARRITHSSIGTRRMLNVRVAADVGLRATLRPTAPGVLGWQGSARFAGERRGELVARADVELAVDLVEVVLDRAGADEEPGADLGVGEAAAREARDLRLSRREPLPRFGGASAWGLAGGLQLARGAFGERLEAHRREHLVRSAQLLASVQAPFLAAQPFSVEQMGAGEVDPDARAREPLDRLAVEALGGLVLAEQRARAGLDAPRPFGAAGSCVV